MKSIKFLTVILSLIFMFNTTVQSQTRKKSPFPYWSISPVGGVAFPVGQFGDIFKTGISFGIDGSYRVNKEVGFYVKVGYNIFPSKVGGEATDGKYLEYTAGPRYFFTSKDLKSAFFLEAGLGGYSFKQDAYATTAEVTDTKFGVNGGLGAILNLGTKVDLIIKVKYHNILTSEGSTSYISPVVGIDIRL